MKLSLRIGAVSAFTLIGFLAAPGPARAACFGTSGANTCSLFRPETSSAVTNTGGFSGMAMDTSVSQAKIMFATNGQWQSPFTITGIKLSGEGITTTLDFGSLSITPSTSWNLASNHTPYINLDTTLTDYDYSNNLLSFTIPANVANTTGNYSSISARIVYADAGMGLPSSTASRAQSTAINSVPSPLPLLGASSAFAFSRRLRQRLRQAT